MSARPSEVTLPPKKEEERPKLRELQQFSPSDFVDVNVKPLGKGAYGEVRLVQHVATRRHYARKVMKKGNIGSANIASEKETSVFVRLDHPFILKCHGTVETSDTYELIVDFQVTSLWQYVQEIKTKKLPWAVAKHWAAQVVVALSLLHNNQILYRDLKPENVLISNTGHIVLADFGLSKVTGPGLIAKSIVGSPFYIAPEILLKWQYDQSIDWWSYGIFLCFLVFGDVPYDPAVRDFSTLMQRVVHGPPFQFSPKFRQDAPEAEVNAAIDLLYRLLERSSSLRAGEEAVKSHPFFQGVDWARVERLEDPTPGWPNIPPIDELMAKR